MLEYSPCCRDGLADFLRRHAHAGGIIVCESRRFLCMKPCRTGGTSLLREFLEPRVPGIIHQKDHPKEFREWMSRITDDSLREYFIFSVIRNPWDRAVSIATYFRTPLAKFAQYLARQRVTETRCSSSLYHFVATYQRNTKTDPSELRGGCRRLRGWR